MKMLIFIAITGLACLPHCIAIDRVTGKSTQVEQALPQELLNAVVVITGAKGDGTGFICQFRGKPFVATNQHVLAVGAPLTIRTGSGQVIETLQFATAGDADIALIQCKSLPPEITPLVLATLPDADIHPQDTVIIPGNSKGDGVITQTPGKLLAVGPQQIEVDNPVYPGNSGSPIIHVGTKKVIGVLTRAKLITLNAFEKASFKSRKSAIKSEIRYFGHRIDSVQQWEALDWNTFQMNEQLIALSQKELGDIEAFLTNSSGRFKDFKELHLARNNAVAIQKSKTHSEADKFAATDKFLRDIESLARRCKTRLQQRKIYFTQKREADAISQLSDMISGATVIAKREIDLTATLLQRGN